MHDMTGKRPRSDNLQLQLTREETRQLLLLLAMAGESAYRPTDPILAERWRSYLEYRAIRKWGPGWRPAD